MTTTQLVVTCQECGAEHPATYSHEGSHGEGAIFAVVCDDGLTDYYTAEAVRETAASPALDLSRR